MKFNFVHSGDTKRVQWNAWGKYCGLLRPQVSHARCLGLTSHCTNSWRSLVEEDGFDIICIKGSAIIVADVFSGLEYTHQEMTLAKCLCMLGDVCGLLD